MHHRRDAGRVQLMIAVYLVSTADGYRGIYWKGDGNDHRTPSLFIHPNSTTISFRASTTERKEAWNIFNTPLPIGLWCHVTVASRGDGMVVLYAHSSPSPVYDAWTRGARGTRNRYSRVVFTTGEGSGVNVNLASSQRHPASSQRHPASSQRHPASS